MGTVEYDEQAKEKGGLLKSNSIRLKSLRHLSDIHNILVYMIFKLFFSYFVYNLVYNHNLFS